MTLAVVTVPEIEIKLMVVVCSGHSTRYRDIFDGSSYGDHMIDDCGHDGHGHVGAPNDDPLLSFDV